MEKFIVSGPSILHGDVTIAGAKNVALKAIVVSLLTEEPILLHNMPHIRDVLLMLDVVRSLGAVATFEGNTVEIQDGKTRSTTVPLEIGARLRTSSMVLGPMLSRYGKAMIPNPGGCRIGARPIDRHIEGLREMGAAIDYSSTDGYFHAEAKHLHGAEITFEKNTHTGTETLILAAVLADGTTILRNAAEEVEIDDLIALLNSMGANIKRTGTREITIIGVKKLHGTEYTIMSDRNEEVTFAIGAVVSKGSITVHHSERKHLKAFFSVFEKAGGKYREVDDETTEYFYDGPLTAVDVITGQYPGFMTDWQAPWALLMTQANGVSTIHETVFENRFSYVEELRKMGADIAYFDPDVPNPKEFYNFNWEDKATETHQAIRITGPTLLHNAITSMSDLRAGATVVLAAIIAKGQSYIHGVEQIDRGYEHIEERLKSLGAAIERIEEDIVA
ncbi:MAG: UDP-N-acetylglucosamine 1-carboxyvinyltransferase [Candidatus Gottesmanbacteria bacterium]